MFYDDPRHYAGRTDDEEYPTADAVIPEPWEVEVWLAYFYVAKVSPPLPERAARIARVGRAHFGPLLTEHVFEDLRNGLHGRAGVEAARELAARFPHLAAIPVDHEQVAWIREQAAPRWRACPSCTGRGCPRCCGTGTEKVA
jgi:hypothetical protein